MEKLIEVLKLIPVLFTVVKAVEEVLPEGGHGKDKLQLVRELVEVSYGEVEKLWPIISKAVSVIVAFFNAKGIFKK